MQGIGNPLPKEPVMVHELESRFVEALLDRLDPRLDEPCHVPGCSHLTDVDHDVARAFEPSVAA